MTIHWIQHVEFEGLGSIAQWADEQGITLTCSRLWAGDALPTIGPSDPGIDGLIVMGGPMGVHDKKRYPWLTKEKAFIREAISRDIPVLGICLGAQLIADVLGARVRAGEHKEIGFFPLRNVWNSDLCGAWKGQLVFHWHGDTFDLPDGAVWLASSDVTENQSFLYKENVMGLQFHLETTEDSFQDLYEHGAEEVVDAPSVQTIDVATQIRFADGDLLADLNALMASVLNRLFISL